MGVRINDYLSAILCEAGDLRAAVSHFDRNPVSGLSSRIAGGHFDRIILSGMGASLYAGYPTWLELVHRGLPAWHLETGELLHHAGELITPGTLLWLISQSGRSAEIVNLLQRIENKRPALILSVTNDLTSPIAQSSDIALSIDAGVENSVSTRTYVNTLAVMRLIISVLLKGDFESVQQELWRAAEGLDRYLFRWQSAITELNRLVQNPSRLVILGRGPSLASAWTAGLILKEGSRINAEGMSSAQFRHGPVELADPTLTAVVIQGKGPAIDLNRRLALDLAGHGARVIWLGAASDPELPTSVHPASTDSCLPIAEIVPLQLLNVPLAAAAGIEPGAFRNSGKVTTLE